VRIVLDTNVFISGIFFTGPPFTILQAWKEETVTLLISPPILEEYQRVAAEISKQFPGIDLTTILQLIDSKAEHVRPTKLPSPVCDDPDDDKFLVAALAGKTQLIVSGDKALLRVAGYQGLRVLRPRTFVDEYLS